STGIALLIFCGAVGKSGQVPLHVWLPDAMEGPTPVSALIHAATMVAAGVFLVARVYPLMSVHIGPDTVTTALKVVAWVGAITAVFAASIAVAQNDIKRILAYSTISQLGYMMLGLGVGGVAVGMFHLIAHAFFKALLFMGAGSVIHGCGEEQNIRRMGGLRKYMPLTFATYAVGMLALCGFPLVFSGFWSKDAILHAASIWSVSRVPFYLGIIGALLTAFYMTRQVCYVFFGKLRLTSEHDSASSIPHESPAVMTVPLVVLAILAILFGFVGTPAWPWFNSFLEGRPLSFDWQGFHEPGVLHVMWTSTVIVLFGFFVGWWWYGRKPEQNPDAPDRYERIRPRIFHVLQNAYFVDQLYRTTFVRLTYWFAHVCDWFDRWIWGGAVWLVSSLVLMFSGLTRTMDNVVVNGGFDRGTDGITFGSRALARLQGGRAQSYLRILGLAFAVLVLILLWGHHG
ncbi:MAG: NADH-quinone oxidoreductase subunit L, partial [Acidobacteriaceae bacterium]|nr:NADH-quinone oxidoreductase subunit L [Acidobacteriaceae bacterium]